jgi:hypothetical protein
LVEGGIPDSAAVLQLAEKREFFEGQRRKKPVLSSYSIIILWRDIEIIVNFYNKHVSHVLLRVLTQLGTILISQGVTKRCLQSWLTNSALEYEPNFFFAGGGGKLLGLSQ